MFQLKTKCLCRQKGVLLKAVCLLKESVSQTNKIEKSFLFWVQPRFWGLLRNNSRQHLFFICQHLVSKTLKAVSTSLSVCNALNMFHSIVHTGLCDTTTLLRVSAHNCHALVFCLYYVKAYDITPLWNSPWKVQKVSPHRRVGDLSLQDNVFPNTWVLMAYSFLLHQSNILYEEVWEGGRNMTSAKVFCFFFFQFLVLLHLKQTPS